MKAFNKSDSVAYGSRNGTNKEPRVMVQVGKHKIYVSIDNLPDELTNTIIDKVTAKIKYQISQAFPKTFNRKAEEIE